jgi:hypothetical protein
MKKYITSLVFVLICTVLFSQNKEGKTPIIVLKVPLGKAVVVDNVTILFKEILEDSRCPKGTTCVWQGRVRLLVEVSNNGLAAVDKEIILGASLQSESIDTELFSNENIKINALNLTPYPDVADTSGNKDYFLLIRKD